MKLDINSKFGEMVSKRLESEMVIWLTTMSMDGRPQPNPVWFFWDGESILIYTMPDSIKVKNIRNNNRVSLNFNCTFDGGEVVVFSGDAIIDGMCPPADKNLPYLEKYSEGIADIQMTPESMGAEYHVALRVYPIKVRGF